MKNERRHFVKKNALFFLILLISFFISPISHGCDIDDNDYKYEEEVWDPFEPINQATFRFNDFIYDEVVNPVSKAYVFITPSLIRTGISNFMHNLVFPKRFIGAVTQTKFNVAIIEFGEFVINSTFGIGGLIKVAEVKTDDEEDIGQSLAYWNIPAGPYIIWPLFGPSNFRDSLGLAGDFLLNPISYTENVIQLTVRPLDIINEWPEKYNGYKAVTEEAVDPYTALKSAYEQYRDKKIRN